MMQWIWIEEMRAGAFNMYNQVGEITNNKKSGSW
jgi:hypothetical protein